MELSNEFTVDVPLDEAWDVLTDLERIAPCMPGAALEAVEDGEYRGVVKVKVGPVTAQYRGKATFLEQDADARRAVVRAEGREARGQGNASATITATLEEAGAATRVRVVTELAITGRVAQFGRGVLAEVSNRLLDQFVEQLEVTVLGGTEGAASSGEPPVEDGLEPATARPGPPAAAPAPVNLFRLVGPVLARRAAAALAGLVALLVLARRRRRRRGAGGGPGVDDAR
jgi:carbon monoxide dehydrogenase subunit G